MKNYELPEEEHNKRIEEILNVVPEKSKEWLESKLAYSNEPNLRRRLREIFDKYSEIVNNFIANKKVFINRVVITRNYLTHYGEESENIVQPEKLYPYIHKLNIILLSCLLNEIGFKLEEINNMLRKYNEIFHPREPIKN